MALAEAGADIAIGTLQISQEFAVASIANEVWAVGRQQFSTVLDAEDAVALAAFAAETVDRLGRCDLLLVSPSPPLLTAPPEEISAEEWAAALRQGLTVPFLAFHAFQPVIERDGGGLLLLLHGQGNGLVAAVTRAACAALAAWLDQAWSGRGLRVNILPGDVSGDEIVLLAR